MGGEELIMRIRRRLPTPPEVVFAAWTDPDSVAAWMCPVPTDVEPLPVEAQLDVRVGGAFRISMDLAGTVFTHVGEYVEISPPRRLVFTWTIPRPDGARATLVTVTLDPADGGETQMEILHERLPDPDLVRRHEEGWAAIAQRLARHLR